MNGGIVVGTDVYVRGIRVVSFFVFDVVYVAVLQRKLAQLIQVVVVFSSVIVIAYCSLIAQ